jgi:spoIIIJ-associated protein
METKQEKVKKFIKDFLDIMEIPNVTVDSSFDEERGIDTFTIRTDFGGMLIGRDGERFSSFVHLVKKMIAKNEGEEYKVSIDVNNFQKSLTEKLRNKALILSNQARDFKKNVEMEPMSSYERMIVHDALAGQNNIKTESDGVGRMRHVVIKYVEDGAEENKI